MAQTPKTLSQSPAWKDPEASKVIKNMMATTEIFAAELLQNGHATMKYAKCDGYHVPFVVGNSKLGEGLFSFSLRPLLDCGNCSVCMKNCYDLRHDVTGGACMEMRCLTYAILTLDPERFWNEVEQKAKKCDCIRANVGGDIIDDAYFDNLRNVASKVKDCKFLIFTKMYDIVNKHIEKYGELPENLHVIFSRWPGVKMSNPYDLPTSFPVFSEVDCDAREDLKQFQDESPKFYWHCNDDCTECSQCGKGCFALSKGDSVGFNYH